MESVNKLKPASMVNWRISNNMGGWGVGMDVFGFEVKSLKLSGRQI